MNYQSMVQFAIPLVLVGAMYFLLIAPQKKREKAAVQMLSTLKEGDEIVTIGGVIGKVLNIKDDEVIVETSIEKTQIRMMRWSIKQISNKSA